MGGRVKRGVLSGGGSGSLAKGSSTAEDRKEGVVKKEQEWKLELKEEKKFVNL